MLCVQTVTQVEEKSDLIRQFLASHSTVQQLEVSVGSVAELMYLKEYYRDYWLVA